MNFEADGNETVEEAAPFAEVMDTESLRTLNLKDFHFIPELVVSNSFT